MCHTEGRLQYFSMENGHYGPRNERIRTKIGEILQDEEPSQLLRVRTDSKLMLFYVATRCDNRNSK